MGEVRDALLVAGGLGTRMLPVSATLAKESLPLIDIPALVHLAREAISAGATRLHIITSPRKDFSNLLADNSWLQEERPDIPGELFAPFADVEVFVHVQKKPKGLGDAIHTALCEIKGPFFVLLGDNILIKEHVSLANFKPSNACKLLLDSYLHHGLPCVGLIEVENVEQYGIVKLKDSKIIEIIEKPQPNQAPSNFALCGRYLFTEDTKDLLLEYSYETYSEMQSIEIQKHWMRNNGLIGVHFEEYQWYDSGSPLIWLKSQIDHALRRKDYSNELKTWLERRLQR